MTEIDDEHLGKYDGKMMKMLDLWWVKIPKNIMTKKNGNESVRKNLLRQVYSDVSFWGL
jgi:hypothetical protein